MSRALAALGRNGSILLAGQATSAVLSAVVVIVLARGLGSTVYGQLALISTSVYVISQVIDVRIYEGATRFGSHHLAVGERGSARAVLELGLAVNLAAGLIAAGLIALASSFIAGGLIDDESLTGEVLLFSAVAPLAALQAASFAVLRVLDRFAALAILIAAAAALRLIAVIAAVASGGGLGEALLALVLAEASAAFIQVGFAMMTIRARLPGSGGFVERIRTIAEQMPAMGRFIAASNAIGTLRVLNGQADVLLVGYLASPAAAGILKVARSFTNPLTMLSTPFTQSTYPELVQAASSGRMDRFRELTWPVSRAIARLLTPLAIAIAATSPLTIPLLVGPGYGEAPLTIVPLAVAGLLSGILFWLQPAALALDMQVAALRAMAAATLIQLLVLLLLVPVLGAPAAGIAALLLVASWAAILLPRVDPRRRRQSAEEPVVLR